MKYVINIRNVINILILAIISSLMISCIPPSMIVPKTEQEQWKAPEKRLMHKNPKKGDFADYRVTTSDGRVYHRHVEVTNVVNDTIEITETVDHLNLVIVMQVDRDGNVLTYSENGKEWQVTKSDIDYPINKTTMVTYNSKEYTVKPFIYVRGREQDSSSMFNSINVNFQYTCVAYSHPGFMFNTVYQKNEVMVSAGSKVNPKMKMFTYLLSQSQYVLNPQASIGNLLSGDNLRSLLESYLESTSKEAVDEMGKKIGMQIDGDIFSGDFRMTSRASEEQTLVRQGNKYQ